jgi:deoxyribose-phosphate aldolase
MTTKEKIKSAEVKIVETLKRAGRNPKPFKNYRRPGREDDLNRYIDHTLLKADTTREKCESLYKEAVEWNCFSVCIPPNRVKQAAEVLSESPVKVCTVVGFPLGYQLPEVKAREVELLTGEGCDEFDMVIPVGLLKDRDILGIFSDIGAVTDAAGEKPVKVILEMGLLEEEEKIFGGLTALLAGAAMLKTSTGFAGSGAAVEDIKLLRMIAGDRAGVKAAGGIKSGDFARELLNAGADRIGASSTGIILGKEAAGKGVSAY